MSSRQKQSLINYVFVSDFVRNMLLLTFFANLLTGLLPFHHVITASGRDPDVLHSTSYRLSAETCFSFVKIVTLWGFTGKKEQDILSETFLSVCMVVLFYLVTSTYISALSSEVFNKYFIYKWILTYYTTKNNKIDLICILIFIIYCPTMAYVSLEVVRGIFKVRFCEVNCRKITKQL